jgi:hypothetical protein
MDIQTARLQAGNIDGLSRLSSSVPPSSLEKAGEISTGDSLDLGASPDAIAKPPVFTPTSPKSATEAPSKEELASLPLQQAPVPAVSGAVLHSILGWLTGKNAAAASPSCPENAQGAPAEKSQGERIAEAIAAPLGDSTLKERKELFNKIEKMIFRVEGGQRGSYQQDEALEHYRNAALHLHRDQPFKEFAAMFERIADHVDLNASVPYASDIVFNELHGKREKQDAYLSILENTWDAREAEKMFKEMNKFSVKHAWEDRRDAMVAITSVTGRMLDDFLAPKPKLIAINAFKAFKNHLKEGETIKDVAEELKAAIEPKRQMSGYQDFLQRGINFSIEIRDKDYPPAERTLLMKAYSRFGNSYGPVQYAMDAHGLVKEPLGNSTFLERSGVMQGLLERDYEPGKVLGSYKVIRDATGSDESVTDVAKAFFTLRDLTWSAEDAQKAFHYTRNILHDDEHETAFFSSLFKYAQDAGRSRGFYEAIAQEPLMEKQVSNESRDDRRGIMRDLISWYMESENYKSPRHGNKWETEKVMESVREDYRTIAGLTKRGESPCVPAEKFMAYISKCKTVHYADEARKALFFTRKDLNDNPKEVAYFDRLQERTVWVDQAKERYNAFAGLQVLENPIGSETRDARRDLFMSRYERYAGWETPKCVALALRDYELITKNLNPGESLEEATKRIDGWMEKIRGIETLKSRGDAPDVVKLLARLNEPGESLDDTLARTTSAIGTLEKQPPYNGFDDMWFTDFTRPIYLGLTFIADALADGTLGDISPKQAFSDLMTLLAKDHYIEDIKELMLSRANLQKADEKKTCVEQVDDQVIIAGIKLDIQKMNKIGPYGL